MVLMKNLKSESMVSFKEVISKSSGINKEIKYKEIMRHLLSKLNVEMVIEEQSERFHQNIKDIKRIY